MRETLEKIGAVVVLIGVAIALFQNNWELGFKYGLVGAGLLSIGHLKNKF